MCDASLHAFPSQALGGGEGSAQMSDPTDPVTETKSLRGEAAWKAHRDAIEARNTAAKKDGKARHDAWERTRETARRATDAREERRFLAERDAH